MPIFGLNLQKAILQLNNPFSLVNGVADIESIYLYFAS